MGRKEAHADADSLRKHLDKVEASNKRYKARVKKLRSLLDERTAKLTELWGFLDDIKREVERVTLDGDSGDWAALVATVRRVVGYYQQTDEAYQAAIKAHDSLQVRIALTEAALAHARVHVQHPVKWAWTVLCGLFRRSKEDAQDGE